MDLLARVNSWLRNTLWGIPPAAPASDTTDAPIIPKGAGFDRDQAEPVPRRDAGRPRSPAASVRPSEPEPVPGAAVNLHDRVDGPVPSTPAAIDAAAVIERFRALGFTVTGPDPTRGIRCVGRIEGYPKPVSFFIPPGYAPGETVDLVLQLHGWTLGRPAETEVFGRYDFGQYLATSGTNAILVVPESDDRAATYNAQWNEDAAASATRFTRFMDGVVGALGSAGLVQSPSAGSAGRGAAQVGNLVITGHSGAHRAISHLVSVPSPYCAKVRAIGLFDATFEIRLAHKLADWAVRLERKGGLFFSAFVAGSDTDAPGREIRRIVTEERGGSARLMGTGELSGDLPAGTSFLQEKKNNAEPDQHWKVLTRYYSTFLQSAGLKRTRG